MPQRNVDAVLAFDASGDTEQSWPDGTSLWTTFERAKVLATNEDTKINMPTVSCAVDANALQFGEMRFYFNRS